MGHEGEGLTEDSGIKFYNLQIKFMNIWLAIYYPSQPVGTISITLQSRNAEKYSRKSARIGIRCRTIR